MMTDKRSPPDPDTHDDAPCSTAHVRDMPTLDSDSLHLRPGVHLYERLDDPKTLLGGRYLHGNVLLKESDLTFITVREGGTLWYGQLILCFTGQYLGKPLELL